MYISMQDSLSMLPIAKHPCKLKHDLSTHTPRIDKPKWTHANVTRHNWTYDLGDQNWAVSEQELELDDHDFGSSF